VDQAYTRTKLIRYALRVALCYAIVLQAFLAAYSAAATNQAANTAAGFVICHNVDVDAPSGQHKQAPAGTPCVFCAMAASANALPADSLFAIVAPSTLAHRLRPHRIAVVVDVRTARAGLARAPPSLA
jgi:hypothetical protein